MRTGEHGICPDIVGKLIDIPSNQDVRSLDIPNELTTDNLYHGTSIAVDESANPPKALKLIFSTTHSWDDNSEDYHFKTNLNGKLEKVVSIFGKINPAGESVKGSGQVSEKDITSPEIKERFRHELDFWLKGAYRKKAAKPAAK
jgi:hypothetical protein